MLKFLVFVLLLSGWLVVMCPGRAFAYLDPGTTGWLYQFGYYVFYSAIAFFLFFYKNVKLFFASIRQRIFPPRQ